MTPPPGLFSKLSQSPEQLREIQLRHWAETIEGATPMRDVKARERVKVAGVIQNIRIDPREGSGSIEATFRDGTGELTAKWLGRQQLNGIKLGWGLVVEGIFGSRSDSGECTILNPEYNLIPSPEHG